MWIDFEGIDGSGKTTLSNAVAARLREEGRDVVHLREQDRLGSRISESLRAFTRDTQQLELADRTELLLNCAREVQLWEELLKPALKKGQHVIADRSIYSHLAMACGGRCLDWASARQVASFTTDGLWPDLVVFVDTDPALARARKKARKLKLESVTDGSRKGLAGTGLPARMRDALVTLAERDPARWLRLDNDGATLDELVETVLTRVRAWLASPVSLPVPDAEQLDASQPRVAVAHVRVPVTLAGVRERFLEDLAALGEREPGAAACLLSSIDDDDAHAIRERLAFAAPEAVAYSLLGCVSPAAWRLRKMLSGRAPRQVAASLAGLPERHHSQAYALREALIALAPAEVAASLVGLDDEAAMALRRRLFGAAPAKVLASLARVPSDKAWAFRDALTPGEPQQSFLPGLEGDGGERAWQVRDAFATTDVLATLSGLCGVSDAPARRLRARWIERAPRPVLRSLAGVFDDESWELRARWAARAPEALGRLEDVDDARAWALREQALNRWPARVLRSLGGLRDTPRGAALIETVLAQAPGDLSRRRALVLAQQGSELSTPAGEVTVAREVAR